MYFKENSKAIYLQIADKICDDILAGDLRPGDRLPSVREYAAAVQVNPNTLVRTYDYLSQLGIIYQKRGIGFFLDNDAPDKVKTLRQNDVLDNQLGTLFGQLRLLGITPDELKAKYQEFLRECLDLTSIHTKRIF